MKYNHIIATALALMVSGAAMAQNLNPTVNVTSTFNGKLAEFEKQGIPMAVPDSLFEFDHDFDYSVFSNPYKGAYDFRPYSIKVRPQGMSSGMKNLYVKAGAGYNFVPVVEAVFSPEMKDRHLKASIFENLDGYSGKYRATYPGSSEYVGNDYRNKLGGQISYDMRGALLSAKAAYSLDYVKDNLAANAHNGIGADINLQSKSFKSTRFNYDLSAGYVFDHITSTALVGTADFLDNAHRYYADAYAGYRFNDANTILAGVSYDKSVSIDKMGESLLGFSLGDRYDFASGSVKAGLKLDRSLVSTADPDEAPAVSWGVFPFLDANVNVIPGYLSLYAKIDGGQIMNTFASLFKQNPHYLGYSALDFSRQRVFAVGLDGNLFKYLGYDVTFGYEMNGKAPLYMLSETKAPILSFDSYNSVFAGLSLNWKSERFESDGSIVYRTFYPEDIDTRAYGPSPLSFNGRFIYNWNGRIHAGVWTETAAARPGKDYDVPGYVDLGIYGSYAYSRRLTIWIQGGNLLNREIQRNPFYTEPGLNITGGVIFSL